RFRLQVDDGNRNDLYLVTRVEKSSCHKQQHREPLGWSARPLYGADSQLLRGPLSTPLFRLDANRISDEYIQSCLNNHSLMRTTIGAQLVLEVDDADCAAAAVESLAPDVQPIARFLHALFVFPLSLKYDSQRVFPKARNIECELQLRDSDAADARPLAALLCDDATTLGTSATTAVARHNANPEFNEEFLVSLPIARKEKLHLLFNFFHISCKKECTRTPVGHAWLPLRGHVTSQQVALSVFGSLPAGYLSCQALGLGKGLSMPDTRFVAKDAFKVALRLCSSLQSRDPSLEAALETFARINREESSAVRLVALESARKHLKALLSCDVTELIRFSPIILQQILELVAHSSDDDVTRASLLTLLRLVDALQHRSDVIVDFVEQTFTCDHVMDAFDERLLEALEKLLASVKEEEESKLVLRHLWFLFRIQIKAFIQRKHESARKQSQHVLRQCVSHVTHLVTKFSRSEESFAANKSLAAFLARLLSFYSLKCVFQCVDAHLKALLSRDVLLSDLRHHFLAIVLAHEHHVTINQQSPLSLALLFRELKHAFSQSVRHVRQQSVQLLRNLLAKHAFDARNASLAEVVALYTPALDILVDHMTVGDMSDDRRHARHQSLSTTRHDASSLDETKDALICVLFIAQHVTQQYVQSMSAQRVERLLVVMETAIQRFAFREETSTRAQTLPHALHAQDLRLFLSQQNLSVETAIIALRVSRLALHSQPHDDDVIRTVVKLFLALFLAHEHHVTINQQSPLSLALLFRELKHAFSQSVRHVRQQSVQLLRNLLAKHAFDARNANLAEVVALYTPALDILVDHMTVGDMSDDRRHARHQSLSTTRHDASSLDETKDALICVLFIAQHVTQQYVQSMSAQRVERLLVVMETAIQRFAFREETSSRAQTLPHALHAQDLRLFLSQQNLSVETAVIALRTSRLALLSQPHDDDVIRTVVKLFLALLHESQSEAIVVLAFENIALFAHDFSQQLFAFHALFSQLVAKIVEFCDCALKPIRDSGVDLLFKLFVENFKRTRFETIVCVSRLASNHAKDLTRFQASLARIQLLAEHDDEFARDSRLTQTVVRMRDILKATHRIRTESRNPYENCELRLFLANSYAQTSWSLRRTWIENLAEVHARHGDWPEYAMCLVHVIAIVVEQLRARGLHIDDARQHVSRVSPNVSRDDTRIESDDWLETEDSSHVTPEALETLIDDCADSLEKCQLFELAPHVLKVMIARFEALQNHRKLSALFQRIARMHARAAEADASGRRLFDTYFRVAHFGAQNQEYVYREAKVMSLAEMTQKLQQLHPGATIVSDCDSDCVTDSAIVVTHVTPFATHARNDFERHVNVNRFQFEQRIRRENDDDSASRVAQQYKRRVELQTSNWFPFCLKRIPVIERKETVLTPIEVAIDEMEARVKALERVTSAANDVKHLQLVLQGSVHVTVNCGPIAYAKAFLTAEPEVATEAETRLRAVFARFQDLCEKALRVNERLIKEDQKEYHVSLRTSFESFKRELDLRGDDKRTSVQIFDVISGSSLA
ncbi:unnamed protein product, partial [Medioppia subpectinata]